SKRIPSLVPYLPFHESRLKYQEVLILRRRSQMHSASVDLLGLPYEVLSQIVVRSFESIPSLYRVNKRFHALCNDSHIKSIYIFSHFNVPPSKNVDSAKTTVLLPSRLSIPSDSCSLSHPKILDIATVKCLHRLNFNFASHDHLLIRITCRNKNFTVLQYLLEHVDLGFDLDTKFSLPSASFTTDVDGLKAIDAIIRTIVSESQVQLIPIFLTKLDLSLRALGTSYTCPITVAIELKKPDVLKFILNMGRSAAEKKRYEIEVNYIYLFVDILVEKEVEKGVDRKTRAAQRLMFSEMLSILLDYLKDEERKGVFIDLDELGISFHTAAIRNKFNLAEMIASKFQLPDTDLENAFVVGLRNADIPLLKYISKVVKERGESYYWYSHANVIECLVENVTWYYPSDMKFRALKKYMRDERGIDIRHIINEMRYG
ncbi:hypothetical protein BKA69DRAFT_1147229, partial [Paraphysoderma sedebokerense]